MVNPSKLKGTNFEVLVRNLLRLMLPGLSIERPAQEGCNDRGDIVGIPNWTIECKATKKIDLAGGMTEARNEQKRNQDKYHALIAKRPRKSIGESYVVMTLDQLIEIIRDLNA